jgi:ribosomal protein S24E
MTESITEVVARYLANQVEQSRESLRHAIQALQGVKSERVYVNGVRSQVETMLTKMGALDDDYVKLLRLCHEHYGASTNESEG